MSEPRDFPPDFGQPPSSEELAAAPTDPAVPAFDGPPGAGLGFPVWKALDVEARASIKQEQRMTWTNKDEERAARDVNYKYQQPGAGDTTTMEQEGLWRLVIEDPHVRLERDELVLLRCPHHIIVSYTWAEDGCRDIPHRSWWRQLAHDVADRLFAL